MREEILLKRLYAGDESALEQLIPMYYPDILRYCIWHAPDRYLAEDAAQETFLKAVKYLGACRFSGNFRAFLYKIALNTCRDMQKNKWSKRISLEEATEIIIFSVTSLVPFTIGQLQWVNLLGGCVLYLAAVSFTLFLSARAKDNVWALALGMFFVFLPVIAFISVPEALGDWLSCILPSGGIGLNNSFLYAMFDYTFLHIGSTSFWNADVLLILAMIKIPVFLFLAVTSYCRRYV